MFIDAWAQSQVYLIPTAIVTSARWPGRVALDGNVVIDCRACTVRLTFADPLPPQEFAVKPVTTLPRRNLP